MKIISLNNHIMKPSFALRFMLFTALTLTAMPNDDANAQSYGKREKSLMFPSQEIEYMKTILDEYEATGEIPEELRDPVEIIEEIIVEPEPVEITEFPSFHLKSIIYHSRKEWSVWVNDIKINNKTNRKGKYEIRVVNLTPGYVHFIWKPNDERFLRELGNQLPDLKRIAGDTDMPIKNRISKPLRPAYMAAGNTALYFSLRINESFSTETFHTFEGKPKLLVYPKLEEPYIMEGDIEAVNAEVLGEGDF